MKYLYPKNLKSKANLWLWGMKDFAVLCVAALVSVLALAGLKIYLPAVITLCYGFLTIRKDDATVLYYIRYAARYFITEQQTYKWGKNMKTKQKKKNGATVQSLIGIKGFTEYGLLTTNGEMLFLTIIPTNISVLSYESVENKVRKLTLALSAVPDVEIACIDSAERFDDNKAYLEKRAESENNLKVKRLLKKDEAFLDGIQTELTTARKFLFAVRCRNMKPPQVFAYANTVRKVLSEQGFDVHRMGKDEIKRLIALYFDASLTGENIPDYDGEQYFNLKETE